MRQKLRQERTNRDWTYKDVADAIGLSERGYRYIENGERDPSLTTALKIGKLFEKTVDELFVQEDCTSEVTRA